LSYGQGGKTNSSSKCKRKESKSLSPTTIEVTVETKGGNNVQDVKKKKQNDIKIEAALKFIKKMNLAPSDF
jgi:hypothetical protein